MTDDISSSAADFESSPEAYSVKLDTFEGPLDLLIHLIKKHEVNIYEIPIASITKQYLDYVEMMQELNLDTVGEFLVMAATLIHIKSKMLLPRADPTEDEPEEDPREALVRRLLEHQKFKAAAELLHERAVLRGAQWIRPDASIAETRGKLQTTRTPVRIVLEQTATPRKHMTGRTPSHGGWQKLKVTRDLLIFPIAVSISILFLRAGQTIFPDQIFIVPFVQNFDIHFRVELPQTADLSILFGNKALLHRG